MTWGAYTQGEGSFEEIDKLGSQLSIEIHCPVHYPAFGKNIFECWCGVLFPVYMVKAGDWEAIRKKHKEGKSHGNRHLAKQRILQNHLC